MQKKELFSSLNYVNPLADVSTWEFISWNKVPHLENINRFFALKDLSKYWKNIIANSGKVWHRVQILTGRRLEKKKKPLGFYGNNASRNSCVSIPNVHKSLPKGSQRIWRKKEEKKKWQSLQKATEILCWISVSHLWCNQ